MPPRQLSPVLSVDRRGVVVNSKQSSVPPPRDQRPTPIALAEMAKIRRILGLPPFPWKF